MILCTSSPEIYMRFESNSMNGSKGCLIDQIRSKWCSSIELLDHAICACFFKGESVIVVKWLSVVHMVVCEVAIVLQSKSIKLFRDTATGPNLSLTTDHMCLLHFLDFILSCDLDAGTTFDCMCCCCQLSIHVGSHSIHRT